VKNRYRIMLTIIMVLLSSCGKQDIVPSPTNTKIAAISDTSIIQSTRTATPTYLPITPAAQGTSLPESGGAISVDNAHRMTLLASWGKGIQGHVEYTPDGVYLVVASTTGLYFYDPGDYSLVQYIETNDPVYYLAISPDSQIVAALMSGKLDLYQISDWRLVNTIQVNAAGVDFSPDGKMLALGVGSENLQFRDAATGVLLNEFEGIRGVWDVAFSPRSDLIVTSGFSASIWSLDGKITDIVGPYSSGGSTPTVSFSPDGDLLAVGTDYRIHIWRVLENGRLTIYREIDLSSFEYAMIQQVAISPDGNLIAAALSRGVYIWDLRTGARIFEDEPEYGYTYAAGVAWSHDSNTIAVNSKEKGVQIWDVETGESVASLIKHTGSFSSLAWSPDGQRLAAGAEEGTAYLFNVDNGEVIQRFELWSGLNSLAYSPNGQYLAVGYDNEIVHLWNLDGTIFKTLEGFGFGSTDAAFSTDGAIFAASLWENWREPEHIRLWDTQDWSVVKAFAVDGVDEYMIEGFVLAPDQTTGAIWYVDMVGKHRDFIRIVSITYDAIITTLKPISNQVWLRLDAIAYSPDGTRLAALASTHDDPDPRILVWQTSDWTLLYEQSIHAGSRKGFYYQPQYAVSWSPDSTLIAVGLRDGSVQILNADGGELLTTLTGHALWTTGVAFSPDGRILASVSLDGTIMLWGLR